MGWIDWEGRLVEGGNRGGGNKYLCGYVCRMILNIGLLVWYWCVIHL
jgi:hypothetical protein